jgi:hypothetical protein
MRELFRASVILALAVAAGCGGTSTTYSGTRTAAIAAPHDGNVSPIPGDLGYVEVLFEPPVKPGARGASAAMVAYFLGTDGKTALASAPSEVSIAYTVDRMPKTTTLKPSPKTGDPAGAARFASDTMPVAETRLEGDLSATIDGRTVTVPITFH